MHLVYQTYTIVYLLSLTTTINQLMRIMSMRCQCHQASMAKEEEGERKMARVGNCESRFGQGRETSGEF